MSRYECRWRAPSTDSGLQEHYWVDTTPSQPHWPDSAVMRWDLRPHDWHMIWPELVDHPCALLFAPKHPERQGPPRFQDWVNSWPDGFNWKDEIPENLHPQVIAALEGSASETGFGVPLIVPDSLSEHTRVVSMLTDLSMLLSAVEICERDNVSRQLAALALAPDSTQLVNFLARSLRSKEQRGGEAS